MPGADVLPILAEIFVAFAGFTGIVAALGQRSEGKWRPIDVIRFRALLEASLAGLLLAVAPFGLFYAGLSEPAVWSSFSAITAAYIVYILTRTIREQRRRQVVEDPDFVPMGRLILLLLSVPVIVSLVLNAIGMGFPHTFAVFLAGLLFLLIVCCTMFVMLLRFVRIDAT